MEKPRVIVVMGVSGSGKSTVGAALATKHGGKFFDADDFHSAANIAKMAAGHPLDDADRRPWLAELRAKVIDPAPSGGLTVLACSALKKSYREHLGIGANGVALVYLQGAPTLLLQRMQHRHGHYMKAGMLDSQLATLEPPTAEEGATVSVDQSVEETVSAIDQVCGLSN